VSVLLRIGVMGRAGPRPHERLLASGWRSAPGEEFSTRGDHRLGPLMQGLDAARTRVVLDHVLKMYRGGSWSQ
jgi:hypothetical protein